MTTSEDDAPSAFQIRILSTGDTFEVPGHKSILHVLVENGYRVPSSCSDGRCGTQPHQPLGGREWNRANLPGFRAGEYLADPGPALDSDRTTGDGSVMDGHERGDGAHLMVFGEFPILSDVDLYEFDVRTVCIGRSPHHRVHGSTDRAVRSGEVENLVRRVSHGWVALSGSAYEWSQRTWDTASAFRSNRAWLA